MEAKKKLIVALTSVCAVLFAGIVAMGIVWAATSQTITSNIKVTYTATEISGSMSANVYFNSDTPTAMQNTATTPATTTVTFNGATQTTSGTLTPQSDVVLLNENGKTFAIFEYAITNGSTTSAMSAVLTYTDDTTSPNKADGNVVVYAYSSASAVTTPHTNVATLYGTSNANALNTIAGQFITDTVAANSTKYFYIVVAINDTASDAEFSGTFSWLLTKYTA